MTDYGSQIGSQQVGSQYVTAFFDSRADAEAAIDRIVATGVSRSDIRMVEGRDSGAATTTHHEERGFFEALGDFFMPDEDRAAYAEGLNRGGYLVSLNTTAGNRDAILDILDDEGTVDMDAREESWRSEGWSSEHAMPAMGTGMGSSAGMGAGMGDRSAISTGMAGSMDERADTTMAAADLGSMDDSVAGGMRTGSMGRDSLAGSGDETLQVMEERLRVGKREVDHGRVRVRSYVVEEPVEEQVSLHSERVHIERRPVDRAVEGGFDAFQDRTIEATEMSEEAVVSKQARVTEEISLGKTVDDRTETVRDTVRRTEVEIDDARSDADATGSRLETDETRRLRDEDR